MSFFTHIFHAQEYCEYNLSKYMCAYSTQCISSGYRDGVREQVSDPNSDQ